MYLVQADVEMINTFMILNTIQLFTLTKSIGSVSGNNGCVALCVFFSRTSSSEAKKEIYVFILSGSVFDRCSAKITRYS